MAKERSEYANALWLVLGGVCSVMLSGSVLAQAYPGKPIRMITASATGGATDVMARITATALGERLGTQIAVENFPGGANIPGTQAAIRATPDGYTLLFSSVEGLDILPSAVKPPYDAERELIPVAKVTRVYGVLAVPAALKVNSLKELVALAKAEPGKLSHSSTGYGSMTHYSMELFRLRAGLQMLHVPYKSTNTAVQDAVGGRLDIISTGNAAIAQHLKSGALKALGAMSPKRLSGLPDVPTFREEGYDVVIESWLGVFAPAGTPGDITRRLAKELTEVAASKQYVSQMAKFGTEEMTAETLEDFAKSIRAERVLWRQVARDTNIRLTE